MSTPAAGSQPGPLSGTAVSSGAHGTTVRRAGLVAAVRLQDREAPARFSVDLVTRAPRPGRIATGGERIRLVWIGQRRVPGITAGRWLRVEGFLSVHQDLPTIFNPRYELLAGAPHDHRS
ncbi:hypothetical protein ABDK96_14610 [Citricoccus nitrophenolicus]|uniref:Uncharacterized protein n=1 Tax=Citricoccus nitrophenolicus TaxID=863575 RepID=A0ABV0IL68_9MICC